MWGVRWGWTSCVYRSARETQWVNLLEYTIHPCVNPFYHLGTFPSIHDIQLYHTLGHLVIWNPAVHLCSNIAELFGGGDDPETGPENRKLTGWSFTLFPVSLQRCSPKEKFIRASRRSVQRRRYDCKSTVASPDCVDGNLYRHFLTVYYCWPTLCSLLIPNYTLAENNPPV